MQRVRNPDEARSTDLARLVRAFSRAQPAPTPCRSSHVTRRGSTGPAPRPGRAPSAARRPSGAHAL